MSTAFFTPKPFTARYAGTCALATCEKNRGDIEQGDAVMYSGDELMHQRCAARVSRGETDPYCGTCFCYHVGDCA